MGSTPTAPTMMDIKEALEHVLTEANNHLWYYGVNPLLSDNISAIAYRRVKNWLEEDGIDDLIYPNG